MLGAYYQVIYLNRVVRGEIGVYVIAERKVPKSLNIQKIVLLLADITRLSVDAIVNPANASMLSGGGLCGVIHKVGGEELSAACKLLYEENKQYAVGSALVTVAGKLPCRYVIHAVGPKWHEHEDKAVPLIATYQGILQRADELQITSLSIPAIATGIHKYPAEFAARVVLEFLVEAMPNYKHLKSILIVCANKENAGAYSKTYQESATNSVQLIDLLPNF